MLARLWWKDFRAFGPVWLVLLVAAGLLQWLLVAVDSTDARSGGLSVAALCWAVLYAFASGAAAFAGEREARTLEFLDALPVGRWTLWMGKASFTLVSTYVLALLLASMASLGTKYRDPGEMYAYPELVRIFGTVLFEAAAWSLLWSSLSRNPLLAGVLGVLSVYASAVLSDAIFFPSHLLASNDFVAPAVVPQRLVAALGALAASGLVMAWRPRVLASRRKPRETPELPAIPIRATSTGRSLVWQAAREGWTTWLLVALVGISIPLFSDHPFEWPMELFLPVLGYLVAGVSVFGVENIGQARRFLVHHGVAPGAVWWRKLLVWGFVMASIFGLGFVATWKLHPSTLNARNSDAWPYFAVYSLVLADAFSVGLVCGMAISRRITAVLVGVILLLLVVPFPIALASNGMVPAWSVVLVPLIFLGVSRAWAGDWLSEREGARPWLRLAAWLALPTALVSAAYVAYRAYGVPDVGPQFLAASLLPPGVPIDQDAAEAYRQAASLIRQEANLTTNSPTLGSVIEDGWDPTLVEVVAYLKENRPAIEQARKASTLPLGRFEDVTRANFASSPGRLFGELRSMARLLALDTRERLGRGDLPGAWDDILAQFRMANQLSRNTPTLARMSLAAEVHHRAVGLAFDWLGATGQNSETIGRALADLKALPPLPNLSAAMQFEASIIERTLDLPADELAEMLYAGQPRHDRSVFGRLWFAKIIAAPWERERTRRICRLLIARELPALSLEPFERRMGPGASPLNPAEFLNQNWNLTRWILPNSDPVLNDLDWEMVGRRALDQAVAVEAWKLGHDGQYPETLQALVPSLLGRLPLDPYSGRPFGYVRSDGQPIRPPILPVLDRENRLHPTRQGQPLIYSVGPDGRDGGGLVSYGSGAGGDLIYPVP